MKNLKIWILAILFSLSVTVVSIGGGYVAFIGLNQIQNIIKSIEEVSIKPSYDYLKSVTVRIHQYADEGTFVGTGTIVDITSEYTYILTNKHVAPIENSDRIFVVDEEKQEHKAEVLSNSDFVDLSLIRINTKLNAKIKIKGISKVKESEKIYSVGMYLANYYIYTEGTFAGYDAYTNMIGNLPGAGGCSGSGVFNRHGKLVGVIFAGNYISMFQVETSKLLIIDIWDVERFLFKNRGVIK